MFQGKGRQREKKEGCFYLSLRGRGQEFLKNVIKLGVGEYHLASIWVIPHRLWSFLFRFFPVLFMLRSLLGPAVRLVSVNVRTMSKEVPSKDELKKILTPLQYHVTQEKGTERPFSGKYEKLTEAGTYVCLVCRGPLFSSDTKFDAGCGWPAFNDVLDKGLVKLSKDTSNVGGNILLLVGSRGRSGAGMVRTEVQCSKCLSHLGHVFDDGPLPTRKRFCINSVAMDFIPKE